MNRSYIMFLVVALGLALVAAPVSATVLFDDDFESDIVGNAPVIGAGDIGGTWTDLGGASDLVEVGQDLLLSRQGDWLSGAQRANLDTPQASGIVTTSFRFANYGNSTYESWASAWTEIDPGTATYTNRTFDIYFQNSSGSVRYYDGAFKSTGLAFTPGAWTYVTVDYSPAAGTFDLTVDGNTATGLTTAAGAGAAVGQILFGGNTSGTTWMLDDVQISQVPEPSTLLGLGSLIGLVSLFYRKKR